MKLVTVKNTLPGVLDLAPLKDETGRTLALRGNEEREVTEEVLGHPIIQRVLDAKWLMVVTEQGSTPSVVEAPLVEPPPAAPAASEPVVIKTAGTPEELKMPEELTSVETTLDEPAPLASPPATETETPVETPVVSETPAESAKEPPPASSSRPGKPSRK